MLQNCVIFSLFIAAIHAAGELTVLNSPKAISFKGNDALDSQYVGDVMYASMGNAVAGDSNWNGMIINDPFELAKGVICVHVRGISHVIAAGNAKTYQLTESNTDASLNALAAELEATKEPVCDINFGQFDEGVQAFKSCFGNIKVTPAKPTKHLSPVLHNADKQFLQEIGYLDGAAENLADMTKPANVLILRVSVDDIAKAHGEKSVALDEANKLLSASISRLLAASQKSSDSVLFVLTTDKDTGVGRTKRDTLAADASNPFNLATYYSSDYPVIFNIILWFMVVFALSLLAICYAIAAMDPGRDSIIYRMTSTRIKKDN
ncbi:GL13947 [Drosophila persimilis]|uniref:ATPase H(+)-transporting accessory protein 2 n=2 Tax=pseudoobscura subgroup TaxID=32358 RepID=A0A6I8ULR1_DROPS|nr:ATPase H(+)-transporting accessory protein 2 [Drosophila pseudoobscura]XP_002020365.1 renin receptor [Drosophila persimilis]XP_017141494.1 ATPase H(+)-transporting accessory protein 2 [Drosophila miranda]EDW39177.1 GL13947 [Drosophila persimilis]